MTAQREMTRISVRPLRGHRPRLQQCRAALLAALCLLFPALAEAATRTWTGGGGDNNWGTAGNWGGTAPVAGDDLVFPSGASQLSNNNNIAAATSFNSITISDSGYTLAGNSITLAEGNLTDST